MGGNFEQCTIIGNVGQDCELRHTQSGTAVANFSVAVSSSWTDKTTNEKREKTNWYKVSAWNKLAGIAHQHVKKGMSVMVQGTCEASAYMGKDGEPKASLDLTARNIQFLTRPDSSNQSAGDDDSDSQPTDYSDLPF